MAEALAVVASGVGVTSFALQLVDCAIKLRSLWADIKDAPEDVINLIDEIQTLSRVLEAINATHTPMIGNAMFDQCYVFCEQGIRNLESVAKDLEKFLRQKKPSGVLRVVLKKDIIAKHRSQLERAKTSLLLAQQTYQTSLHMQQLQKVDASLATQGRLLLQPVQLPSQSHTIARNQVNSVEDVPGPSKVERYKYPSDRSLSVRRRPPKYRKREKDRLSFRTPTWLTSRVWDIRVREACSGWMLGLSTYNIRPKHALVFNYVAYGDLQGLQRLFDKGEASPFDRNPHGETLLHLAALRGHLEICRFLLDQGVDSKTEDFCQCTPLRSILLYGVMKSYSEFGIHHLLLTEADTDELIDSESVLRLLRDIIWVDIPPGAMKLLQQTVCFPWPSIDLEDRIAIASHSGYNAELYKLILGPGSLLKEAFKVRLTRSVHAPHETLFSHIAWRVGCCYDQKSDDASWQAILREAVSVNGHLCSSEWDSSPLVEFLNGFLMLSTKAGLPEQPHRHWLQSLQRAGADLLEYGQLESRNLKSSKFWFNKHVRFTAYEVGHTVRHDLMLRIVNLAYGPEPEDWHIWFSWPLDEWARDFWFLVENPELFETPEQFDIPGAWLSEESEQWDSELEEE